MAESAASGRAALDEEGKGDREAEIEMALLAALASRDVGEATETVRLDTLSSTEKQVLVHLMRDRLGIAEPLIFEPSVPIAAAAIDDRAA